MLLNLRQVALTGREVKIDAEEHVIMPEDDVLAVIQE
jgi:co-chaperonin GroES (HSP10)